MTLAQVDSTTNTYYCSEGYELLQGVFLGSKDICLKGNGSYSVGDCMSDVQTRCRSHEESQIEGMESVMLTAFNNTGICYSRGGYNYHDVVTERIKNGTTCDSGYY